MSAIRTRTRARLGWIAIVVVLIGGAAAAAAISGIGTARSSEPFDPGSVAPQGARALARILEQHGIRSVVTGSVDDTLDAVGAVTLVLPRTTDLTDEELTGLVASAADVVVVDPRARDVRLLLPGAALSGVGPLDPVEPSCDVPAAVTAGPIVVGTLFDVGTSHATGCYPAADGVGLLTADTDGRTLTVIDGDGLFTNSALAADGNAALALHLLGRHDTVVWLFPRALAESGAGAATPPWVTPAVLTLLAAAVVAGVWRGRRFGPLVAERLPVTVRGTETTAGRARLYARSHDAAHALDELRIASLRRVGHRLGLGASADVGTIADAVAERLGRDGASVRALLVDRVPRTDHDLVAMTADLDDLEAALESIPHLVPRG